MPIILVMVNRSRARRFFSECIPVLFGKNCCRIAAVSRGFDSGFPRAHCVEAQQHIGRLNVRSGRGCVK